MRILLYLLMALSLAGLAAGQDQPQPIGQVLASDAGVHGSVLVAGGATSLLPGATVQAGQSAALIRLRRGGTLQVCPRTALAVNTAARAATVAAASTPAAGGLMLSLGVGAMEADYELGVGADEIITPDFRLLLSGPGRFHLAVSVNGVGDTCVQTLSGDAASVIVSELVGVGVYQVRAGESVEFPRGAVAGAHPASAACGCAPPAETELAANAPAAGNASSHLAPAASSPEPKAAARSGPDLQPATAAGAAAPKMAGANAPETPVEVEAPFVFSAAAAPSPSLAAVEHIRMRPAPPLPSPAAMAPPPAAKKHHRFFAGIGRFFARLFGRRQKAGS